MSVRYVYISSDAPGDSTDITDNVRLYTLDLTLNAEEGSVATSTIRVDDPDGTLDIVGLKAILITETTATGSNTVIGSLAAVDRTVTRGPYQTGAGRLWTVNVVDQNNIAELRVHVGSGNSRPAETDVQRIAWLMSTSELGQVSDTTLVNTAFPVQMDAVDYSGQKSSDILNDCAQASGKNYFIYYREASSSPALFYDFADSTAYTSSVRLTNVLSDIEADAYGLTFAISDDTQLSRSPSRVFSGALVNYDGGAVYEQRTATYNAFRRRDAVVPAENVKTAAKATARAIRYLDEMSTEEDVITTSFRIPAARVNFVREGMRCQFKASHLPGYTDFTWGRVLRRTIRQDSEEEFLVTLELSTSPGASSPDMCSVMGYDEGTGLYNVPMGPTPAGFYPINSTYGTFGDFVSGGPQGNVFYRGGAVRPRPIPDGGGGGWSFSNYNVASGSMPGGVADGGLAPNVQVMVVGPGTMTIWLADAGSGVATAELYKVDIPDQSTPAFDVTTLISTKAATFTTTTFVVPDDGACLHYALIEYTSGNYLYGGFTWVPA